MLRFLFALCFLFSVINTAFVHRKPNRKLLLGGKGSEKDCQGLAVIDADGGPDDAVGIINALLSERKRLGPKILGITCVNGIADVEGCITNVGRTLLTINRADVPIYRGAASTSVPPNVPFPKIYGNDSFEDIPFFPGGLPEAQKEPATIYLVRIVQQYEGQVTLFCMGPLTNIAIAMDIDPDFLERLEKIVIIGGSTRGIGNAAPGRDFNSYLDPYAFQKVLSGTSSDRAVLMPLDLIIGKTISLEFFAYLAASGNPGINFGLTLGVVYVATNPPIFLWLPPIGYGAYIFPGIILESDAYQVDCSISRDARGVLLVDYLRILGNTTFNLNIVTKIDLELYKDFLVLVYYD